MASWGLQINRRLKALVCLGCQAVVLPSQVPTHISKQHKSARLHVDQAVIDQAVASEGLYQGWPVLSLDTPLQYAGVKLVL